MCVIPNSKPGDDFFFMWLLQFLLPLLFLLVELALYGAAYLLLAINRRVEKSRTKQAKAMHLGPGTRSDSANK